MLKSNVNRIIFLYAIFAGFLIVYWGVYFLNTGMHVAYFQGEDRLAEWLTFMFFLSASVVSFWTLRFRLTLSKKAMYYFIFMGFFLFTCAGEEISWGQRVVGYEIPKVLEVINEQEEFNLHNLELEHIHPYGIFSWLMTSYGIILPMTFSRKLVNSDSPVRKYLPPLVLVNGFAFALIIRSSDNFVTSLLIQYFGANTTTAYASQTAELQEMYWGLCMFLSSISIYLANQKFNSLKKGRE